MSSASSKRTGMATDIWQKVDLDLVEVPAKEAPQSDKPTPAEWLSRWKRIRPYIDALASLFWVYAVLKVFIFDVDRSLIELVAPGAGWLADFRLLAFVALLAIAAVIGRSLNAILCVVYVLFFPGVVLFWKVPQGADQDPKLGHFLRGRQCLGRCDRELPLCRSRRGPLAFRCGLRSGYR